VLLNVIEKLNNKQIAPDFGAFTVAVVDIEPVFGYLHLGKRRLGGKCCFHLQDRSEYSCYIGF
jgi:hypothetical protein